MPRPVHMPPAVHSTPARLLGSVSISNAAPTFAVRPMRSLWQRQQQQQQQTRHNTSNSPKLGFNAQSCITALLPSRGAQLGTANSYCSMCLCSNCVYQSKAKRLNHLPALLPRTALKRAMSPHRGDVIGLSKVPHETRLQVS